MKKIFKFALIYLVLAAAAVYLLFRYMGVADPELEVLVRLPGGFLKGILIGAFYYYLKDRAAKKKEMASE